MSKKPKLNLQSNKPTKNKIKMSINNALEIPKIDGDDRILTDLFRDDSAFQTIENSMWEGDHDRLENKANRIFQIILEMEKIVSEWAMIHITRYIMGVTDNSDVEINADQYIQYKTYFTELRLEAFSLRKDAEKTLEELSKDTDKILECGALFDFYIDQYIKAFVSSVKKSGVEK